MIRIRRIRSVVPLTKRYELEAGLARRVRVRRPAALNRLEALVGIDDAKAFIDEADWRWAAGRGDWPVEYEQAPESDDPRSAVRSGMEFERWSGAWSDPDVAP